MSQKTMIYLAGPIEGLTYRAAAQWRHYVEYKLDRFCDILSPLRGRDVEDEDQIMQGSSARNVLESAASITLRDLADVRRADAVLVYIENDSPGFGTCVEIGIALERHTPVILVIPPTHPLRSHPFLQASLLGVLVVNEMREALVVIRTLLNLPEEEKNYVMESPRLSHAPYVWDHLQ